MSGMAEVLAGHQRDHEKRTLHQHCTCGWFGRVLGGDFTTHQAAMLTAAGFGPVKESGAAVLEEAAALVVSEKEHQWRRDSQRLPGAAIVAQRMEVLARILRDRAAAVRGEG